MCSQGLPQSGGDIIMHQKNITRYTGYTGTVPSFAKIEIWGGVCTVVIAGIHNSKQKQGYEPIMWHNRNITNLFCHISKKRTIMVIRKFSSKHLQQLINLLDQENQNNLNKKLLFVQIPSFITQKTAGINRSFQTNVTPTLWLCSKLIKSDKFVPRSHKVIKNIHKNIHSLSNNLIILSGLKNC